MKTPNPHDPGVERKRVIAKLPAPHRDLLLLASFLHHEAIPYTLLTHGAEFMSDALRGVCENRNQLRAVLGELTRAKLLVTRKHTFAASSSVVRHVAGRADDEATLAWANAAYRCVERAFAHAETRAEVVALVPHIRAIGTHAERAGLPLFQVSTLVYSAGLFLHECDCSLDAIPLIRHAVDLCLLVGDENHPLIATRLNSLGLACHAAGQLQSARDCFERALGICEYVFGPTEKAVYTSSDERFLTHPMRNLCRVLSEMDEMEAMQEAYDRALDVYLQVHGPYHSLVAECANDMGHIWHDAGNLEKAALHFEKAIEAETRTDEPIQGNLAAYSVNLGAVRIKQERFDEAEKLYERALQIDTADFGPDSQQAGRDLIGIGQIHHKRGDDLKAREAFEQAQRIAESARPPDKKELRLLAANLGRIAASGKDFDTAIEHQRRALSIATELYGLDAPETSHDQLALARTLLRSNGPVEAYEHFRHALYTEIRVNGEACEHAALIHRFLGEAQEALDDPKEARAHYDKAWAIDRELFGEDHPNTARDFYRIGVLLARQGDTVSAIANLNRALSICEDQLGRDHSRTRRIGRKLAELSL